ncbi:MAG TPA: hypothetical protein VJJ82_05425 [Candidatus Nanoarchaeia archaeon]|nr:hypothetical protein [Candidatus Nanoarchaeia archaeon]
MPTDFEPIKKLPPETQVEELKKVITNLRRHIEEHQRDIRTAETLLARAEDEERVLEDQLDKSIEKTREQYKEADLKATAKSAVKQGQQLENIVGETPTREVPRVAPPPLAELYTRAKTIYESQQKTGVETYEQRQQLYELNRALDEKRRDIEEGKYQPGERQKNLLTSTEQLLGTMYSNNKEGQNKTYRTNN